MLRIPRGGMRRPNPLGFSEEFPPPDGTAPYGGANFPGPVGAASVEVSQSSASKPSDGKSDSSDGFVTPPFQVGSDTYRLRKADGEYRPTSYEIPIAAEEAVAILEEALQKNSA